MNTNTLLNPYQKFGAPVDPNLSNEENLAAAGLTDVNLRLITPSLTDEYGLPIDVGNIRHIVGNFVVPGSNGARVPVVTGTATTAYNPFQPPEVLLPLMEGFENLGLTLDILGQYDNGKAYYAVYRLPAGTVVKGADRVLPYIVATNRNDGSGSARAYAVAERASCANMINSLAKNGKKVLAVRHTRNANPYLMQQVEEVLGITRDWGQELATEIAALEQKFVSQRTYTDRVLPALLGERPDEKGRSQTIFDRKFNELVASWDSPVAAEGDTAWRAYNAVTEWEQHHRTGNDRVMAEAVLNGRTPMEDKVVKVLASI